MKKDKLHVVLNQAVADLSQFAANLHQVHWYMKGQGFLSLHPKMDEFMGQINEQLDEVAERLIIIGGAPYSTLEEFAKNSKIKAKKGNFNVDIKEHIKNILDGYKYLSDLYQEGIDTAEKEGDAVTADIFTSLKGAIEKNIWMFEKTIE